MAGVTGSGAAGATRVKVCGLTRAEDVREAVELGAWALGFVLAESPRQVTPGQAADLIVAARAVRPGGRGRAADADRPGPISVLVVTTQPTDWVAAALDAAGADAVQLSGGADGAPVADVRAAAARLRRRPLVIAAADAADAHLADLVLLDARADGAYGGTGRTLDWAALAARPPASRDRLVLAGGLRPGNVAEAVRLLRPAAVDVSSGVEAGPGRKDHGALRDFFAAVEQADTDTATRAAGAPAQTTRGRSAG